MQYSGAPLPPFAACLNNSPSAIFRQDWCNNAGKLSGSQQSIKKISKCDVQIQHVENSEAHSLLKQHTITQ